MAIVKSEKNEKTGEYWYSVISKEFTISKDGKSQYVRINEKNLSRAILITKDVKEDQ